MKKSVLLFLASLGVFFSGFSQEKSYNIRTVAFYNLENLFDTINDVTKNDEASPIMELRGNKAKVYWDKISKLGSVISQIGKETTHTSPAIIGVSEVENITVLEDLVQSEILAPFNYGIVHYDSPDQRGIDVALLYQKRYFKPVFHQKYNPNIYRNNRKVYTRDQLLVSGYLDDELIHLVVNHWPSRRGGEATSRPLREKAAYQNTKIFEQIREKNPSAKIISMGDFNDDPINASFKKVLNTKKSTKNLLITDFYNPYEQMFEKGLNTLGYRDNINLFDQIFMSSSLVNGKKKNFSSYKLFKAMIFNKRFLTDKKGRYKGYPLRSFSNGNYTGGYSDHYPVYVYLIKEID